MVVDSVVPLNFSNILRIRLSPAGRHWGRISMSGTTVCIKKLKQEL